MSWVDVFSAVVAGLAVWTLLGLALALVLGPLLARRAMQQATRSMLGGAAMPPPRPAPTANDVAAINALLGDASISDEEAVEQALRHAGLVAEDK